MMNKLALYVFPLGVVVGGPFLPIAIIIYWVSNNIWTFGQQHYVFGKIEKEEEAKKEEALARRVGERAGARAPSRPRPQEAAGDGRRNGATAEDGDSVGRRDSGRRSRLRRRRRRPRPTARRHGPARGPKRAPRSGSADPESIRVRHEERHHDGCRDHGR